LPSGGFRIALGVAALVVICLVGVALANEGQWRVAAVVVALAVGLPPVARVILRERTLGHSLAVEVPIVLLLLASLTWRVRSTENLAVNPLDTSGILRTVCVGIAGLLGAVALISKPSPRGSRLPWAIRMYCVYVLVVFLGALPSVHPSLTAYRSIELATSVLVLLGAAAWAGADATRRLEVTLYWFVVALVGSVWLGVALYPDRAIEHYLDRLVPVPFSLVGAYPLISSNGVGTLGVLLAGWSIGRIHWYERYEGNRPTPALMYLLALAGIVTLGASQYRTGYVAAIIAGATLLIVRRKWLLVGGSCGLAAIVLIWKPTIVGEFLPFVLRGSSVEELKGLSGRVEWWQAALTIWQESPLIGRGLLTATRFEVFARMGLSETSSVHSTWVEALVGSGLLGVVPLGLSFLIVAQHGLNAVRIERARYLPTVLLAVLGVRSVTGSTFESFGYQQLIFLWAAWAVRQTHTHTEHRRDPRSQGSSWHEAM